MELYFERLDGWSAPSDIFLSLYANDSNAFWLDREHAKEERFSVIGSGESIDIAELAKTDFSAELPFAFRPGLVGVFGFEASEDSFIRADRAIVFDHDAKALWLIGLFANRGSFDHWLHAALLRLALAGGQTAAYMHQTSSPNFSKPVLRHQPRQYLELISRAKQHIAAGDVYQLCLTNQLEAFGEADPLEVFIRLREKNPTPYAAFLRIGGRSVVCTSPEQFLKVGSDGIVSTKPIKGTRRRDSNPDIDKALAEELASSEKERAENLMIVDLMRNDLSRVCDSASVTVSNLFEVQSYETVHQLVSTVSGRLLAGLTALDAVRAAFPGGSMTGAPKARAIELIEELEQGPRGVYSGVIGYLGADGSADLGMVIRTIVFDEGKISIGIGGGITADSVPFEELEETRIKARALLDVLGLEDPWA